jgi:hypothetical protein
MKYGRKDNANDDWKQIPGRLGFAGRTPPFFENRFIVDRKRELQDA